MALTTLLCLLGQLALQSQARLDEMPRAALERLTGLHVGPAAADDPCDSMPGMVMVERQAPSDHQRSHHDTGGCFLCPLLHLPSIVLGTQFIPALLILVVHRGRYNLPHVRAPPRVVGVLLPPPTGPPLPVDSVVTA